MYIEQLYTNCLAEAAYYIESAGEAVVIDPLRETEPYVQLAQSRGAKLKYIFETHFHADFVSGHIDLARITGAQIVYGPGAKASYAIHAAQDGETFQLGKVKFTLLHTPGHTLESSCFLLHDERGKPHAVFTGDTLFVGDVGRPDLAVKSDLTREDLAALMYESIQNKILPLADDVIVYPGHGAGSACGKNIGTETHTTIGQQRKLNYALQPMTKEQFIAALTDGLTTPPKYFFKDAAINKQGYDPIAEVIARNNRGLTPAQLEDEVAAGAWVLDCRAPEAFEQGYVPGSLNIGLNGQYAIWVGTLIDIAQPLVLVADPGKEEEAVLRLARVGFENVRGVLAGGVAVWAASGRTLERVSTLQAAAFVQTAQQPNAVILDVRNENEALGGMFAGAQNVPLGQLPERVAMLDKSKTYLVHCAGGYRSMIAASILRQQGFTALHNIAGGYNALKDCGLPVAVPAVV